MKLKRTINTMTERERELYTQSRWIALYEGINIIAERAEQLGHDFDELNVPHPILSTFIDDNADIIYREAIRTEGNM